MASVREAERLLTEGVGGFHMIEYDRIFPYDPEYLAAVLRHLGLAPDEKIMAYYRDASREKSEAIIQRDRQLTEEQAAAAARLTDPDLFAFLRTHSVARH